MIDLRTSLFCLFMILNMAVLAEVYTELNEVKLSLNEKSLIYNKEYDKLNHLQTLNDYYQEAMSREQ